MSTPEPPRGRGAASNPPNRFERLQVELDPDENGEPAPLRTVFLRDDSQSIVNYNDSPDIPFGASVNPYRGCEHGCAYCYARPTHEYLGFSAGLDFESRILIKESAPELLRKALSSRGWKPQVVAMSGVTDCYQPVERKLELTRRCLGVLAEFRNPVGIVTKNHLVTRDLDILAELAKHRCAWVGISVTTLDGDLAKELEPRASPPSRRLAAIRELSAAGIPVLAMAAAEAGAYDAAYVPLRLPGPVSEVFESWLDNHRPGMKEKVLGRIREMRGGKLNDPRFGSRMQGEGFFAEQMRTLYVAAKRKAGFPKPPPYELSTESFRVPTAQLSFTFD